MSVMVADAVMPQPGSQTLFLQSSKIKEVLFEGERGPGKTWSMLFAFAQHTGKGYGSHWRGVIFRRESGDLDDIIEKSKREFGRIYPDAVYNKTEKTWVWPGGEMLTFAHFFDENDYWSWHGQELPFIGWEELTTWPTNKGYLSMFSCNRSAGPINMPRIIRSTTNPYGVGKNWVKRRFKLPSHRYKVWQEREEDGMMSPPRLAIPGFLIENKILLRTDPRYVQTLKQSAAGNQEKLKAWLFGDWDAVSGGMFDDIWNAGVHVVKPFYIPNTWTIRRAYDWGGAKPGSYGLWAESNGDCVEVGPGIYRGLVPGDSFRIGEWYSTSGQEDEGLNLTPLEIAKCMVACEEEAGVRGRVTAGPADVNIFDKSHGRSIYDTLRADPFHLRFDMADKGPNSRKMGWQVARERLLNSIPGEHGTRERPGLFIFSTCTHFIDLVPTLPRDLKDPDDVDTKSEDHIGDELRYYLRRASRRAGRQRG